MFAVVQRPIILLWITLNCTLSVSHALPSPPSRIVISSHPAFIPRGDVIENIDGHNTVLNSDTSSVVTQGLPSDGGGSGFDVPAILWIAFSFVGGSFLAFVGLRGWRLTIGIALGLIFAVCSWAAIINTINTAALNDLVLALIIYGFFGTGVALGVFEIIRMAGLAALGISGGLSLGIRIVILRSGLLVPTFFVNWLIIAALGVLGLSLILLRQRIGIVLGCTLTGTFLLTLGADLLVNKQNGMSRGLRFLLDHHIAHQTGLITGGYQAVLSTQIMLGVSIALAPALAYAQHRFFPKPFDRSARPESTSDLSLLYPEIDRKPEASLRSRFSM